MKPRMCTIILAGSGVVLGGFAEDVTSQAGLGGPHSQTCAHVEFQTIRPLLGEWRVEASDRVSPNVYERTTGTSVITTVMDGCVLLEEYRGDRQGTEFHRLTMLSIAPDGAFEHVRLDSGHGAFTISHGQWVRDTLVFEYARPMADRVLRTWAFYTELTADRFRLTRYLQRSDDVEPELTFDAIYERIQ